MLRYAYEKLLERGVSRGKVPRCIAIVLPAGYPRGKGWRRVGHLVGWCESVRVRGIILFVGDCGPGYLEALVSELRDLAAEISVHTADEDIVLGTGGPVRLVISLGYGGKKEVAEAIGKLLEDVESGLVDPEEIDEAMIEAKLRFKYRPDLVIRAGGRQLSDFMIWQAAYSELYFTDMNWDSMRKTDFLRAIRDYQQRERRFGK